jgi:hypothetical protein
LSRGDLKDIGGGILLSRFWENVDPDLKTYIAETFSLRLKQMAELELSFNPAFALIQEDHDAAIAGKNRLIAGLLECRVTDDREHPCGDPSPLERRTLRAVLSREDVAKIPPDHEGLRHPLCFRGGRVAATGR